MSKKFERERKRDENMSKKFERERKRDENMSKKFERESLRQCESSREKSRIQKDMRTGEEVKQAHEQEHRYEPHENQLIESPSLRRAWWTTGHRL
jgi:hypothetical protein